MLNFLAGTNTMLADIPTYSVLDFPSNEKGVGNLQRDRHLAKFIDELESGPVDSRGLLIFNFSIDFIGGQ